MTDPSETLPETWADAEALKAAEALEQVEDTSESVEDGPTAGTVTDASGTEGDDVESGPDLSYLDRKVRPTMEALLRGEKVPEEDLQALIEEQKQGYTRTDILTKKRQKDTKELRKAQELLEQLEPSARRWNALLENEKMQKWVLAFDPSKVEDEEEVPEDLFIGREPAEAIKILDARWEKRLAAEKAKWEAELLGKIEKPVKEATALDEAANAWAAENDVPDEVLIEACRSMSETIGRERLDPDLVVKLLPKFASDVVAQIKQQAQAQQARSKAETQSKARAASPRGGVGAVTPEYASAEKRIAEKEESLGRRLTTLERANLYFDDLIASKGMSERELDMEWMKAKSR